MSPVSPVIGGGCSGSHVIGEACLVSSVIGKEIGGEIGGDGVDGGCTILINAHRGVLVEGFWRGA